MNDKRHLLVVYHSQSGATAWMADAVVAGARDPEIQGVELRVRLALEAAAEDLLWSDALILGTPENFGYMSGGMKCFFDRVYYACLDRISGLPCAYFVRAGNDGSGALTSMRRILSGLSVQEVQEPVVIS